MYVETRRELALDDEIDERTIGELALADAARPPGG
jgi:hypothetical protein